jgi:hypothetical protein
MAEINLLQTNNSVNKPNPILNKVLIILSILLLVITVGLYFYFRVSNSKLVNKIAEEEVKHQALQSEIRNDKNYPALVSIQEKTKIMNSLLENHVNWSGLIPYFAEATYKGTSYKNFTAESNNFDKSTPAVASISGSVDSFVDLSKLIKGLQLKDFSNTIRDVRLVSVNLNSTDEKSSVSFVIKVLFNNTIINANN